MKDEKINFHSTFLFIFFFAFNFFSPWPTPFNYQSKLDHRFSLIFFWETNDFGELLVNKWAFYYPILPFDTFFLEETEGKEVYSRIKLMGDLINSLIRLILYKFLRIFPNFSLFSFLQFQIEIFKHVSTNRWIWNKESDLWLSLQLNDSI